MYKSGSSRLHPITELQKCADRADQSVLFFLAGANFLGKAREKLLIFVANFLGEKLVSANFYAFCNYEGRSQLFDNKQK